jgi:hypothetical protein
MGNVPTKPTSRVRATWTRRAFFQGLVTGLALLGSVAQTSADPLGWVPSDTRVLFRVDSQNAASQARARQALGLDALLGHLATGTLAPSQVKDRLVAYVVEGTASHPVVLTFGTGSLARTYDGLHGAKLETAGGKAMHANPASPGWAMALVEPGCIAEGPRQTLRAVLQHAASHGRTVADLPASSVARRLVDLAPGPLTAVGLVYVAPPGGTDLYSILQDLDRTLGGEMSSTLSSYQAALKALGTTQGLRLDVQQDVETLATTLRLVMTNTMVAQIATVSLQAGKDMAKVASDAAVKAGTMSTQDATVLTGALESMQTRSEGDLVTVRLRVADGVAARAH